MQWRGLWAALREGVSTKALDWFQFQSVDAKPFAVAIIVTDRLERTPRWISVLERHHRF
jgi:hypothetical protein